MDSLAIAYHAVAVEGSMKVFEMSEIAPSAQNELCGSFEPSRGREHRTRELDMLLIFLRARRTIFLTTLAGALIGLAVAFVIKATFTSTATILPPQSPQSSVAGLMGQLGSLGGLGSSGAGSILKNTADLYVGILESRTIGDHVTERFHLQEVWRLRRAEDTRKTLKKHVQIEAAKNGLIVITVKEHDAQLASNIANAFVDELYRMNSQLAVTEASQRRTFFDQQVLEEKNALGAAEEDLKSTQVKTGMIELTGQAEMAIRNIAETRAQLANREVQLQSMRTYATDQNPDMVRLQSEVSGLRQQLAHLENDPNQLQTGDTSVPAGKVPGVELEYVRKLREVKYHEAFLTLLSKEFEGARIDQAKAAPIIQVVDRAVPSDRKSGPPRMLIVLGFTFLGLMLSSFWVLLRQALTNMHADPESAVKLNQVKHILGWNR